MTWNIRNKILGSFGVILLLLLIQLIVNWVMMSNGISEIEQARDKGYAGALLAAKIKHDTTQVWQWLTDVSATRAAAGLDEGFDEAERYAKLFHEDVEKLRAVYPEKGKDLDELTEIFDTFYTQSRRMAERYVEEGTETGNQSMAQVDEQGARINDALDALQLEMNTQAQEMMHLAVSENSNNQIVSLGFTGVVILLAIGISLALSGHITSAIGRVTRAAALITQGDLNQQLEVRSSDEIGQMTAAFQGMLANLRQVIADIIRISERLAEGELRVRPEAEYRGDFLKIKNALEASLTRLDREVIADIVRVSEKLAEGELSVRPVGDYRGDFLKIKNALEASLARLEREVIADIVRVSEKLAEGDLRVRPEAEYRGDFLKIKNALEASLAGLNNTIYQTNLVVGQVALAVEQVQRVSQDLAANSEEQSGAVEQVTANLEETDSQISSNAESAKIANQLTNEATGLARAGQEKMGAMTSAMDAIARSSQEIGRIIKVIDEIAFQTNLLALNAAVEAARAGQYGRGFAVVAQEVRSLAGRSAKAAKETSELIAGATRQVQDGVKIADETAGSLTEIVQNVVKVKDLVSEVAAASDEQTRGITEISNAMTQVNLGAQSTSQQSEELAATAVELGNIVERLREETARFKLSESRQMQGGLLPGELSPETLQQIIKLVREQKQTIAAKAPAHAEKPGRAGNSSKLILDRDERGYEDF